MWVRGVIRARPTDALLGEAWDRYEPVLASLATAGVMRSDVAALAVFRTQTVTPELGLVSDALWEAPAPAVTIDPVVSGAALDALLVTPSEDGIGFGIAGGLAHESVGWLVRVSFEAPWYLD